MKYINKKEYEELQFVICGYEQRMIYHEYEKKNKELSAGKSLTVETAKTLFNFVNNIEGVQNYSFSGIIPKNILKYKTDEKFIVWQTVSGLQNILYSKHLSIKSGSYWVPRLVWKLEGNSLSVFAVTKEVKSEKEKLYNAPLFNVSQSGSVCMGNTKFIDNSYNYGNIIKKTEAAFWGSVFTHSNNNRLLSINFTEWCNDEKYNKKPCTILLVDSEMTIKKIL